MRLFLLFANWDFPVRFLIFVAFKKAKLICSLSNSMIMVVLLSLKLLSVALTESQPLGEKEFHQKKSLLTTFTQINDFVWVQAM